MRIYLSHPNLFNKEEIEEIKKSKERQMTRLRKTYPDLFKETKPSIETESNIEFTTEKFTEKTNLVTETTLPTDMFGNYFIPGNYITYPGRQGSNLYMRVAKILKITNKNDFYGKNYPILKVAVFIPQYNEGQKVFSVTKTTINSLDRVVVLPQSYIQHNKEFRNLLFVE